jgi:hypothetical protein
MNNTVSLTEAVNEEVCHGKENAYSNDKKTTIEDTLINNVSVFGENFPYINCEKSMFLTLSITDRIKYIYTLIDKKQCCLVASAGLNVIDILSSNLCNKNSILKDSIKLIKNSILLYSVYDIINTKIKFNVSDVEIAKAFLRQHYPKIKFAQSNICPAEDFWLLFYELYKTASDSNITILSSNVSITNSLCLTDDNGIHYTKQFKKEKSNDTSYITILYKDNILVYFLKLRVIWMQNILLTEDFVKYVYKSNNEYIIKKDGRYLSACSDGLRYTTYNYNNILLDNIQLDTNIQQIVTGIKTIFSKKMRRGYAFVGARGTGKSTIIQKIMNEILDIPCINISYLLSNNSSMLYTLYLQLKAFDNIFLYVDDLDGFDVQYKNDNTCAFINFLDTLNNMNISYVFLTTINDPSLVHNTILKRSGRIDEVIYVEYPNADAIRQLLKYNSKELNIGCDNDYYSSEFDEIVNILVKNHFTPADISTMYQDIIIYSPNKEITQSLFIDAINIRLKSREISSLVEYHGELITEDEYLKKDTTCRSGLKNQ